jgi:hypothetical protein
MFPVTDAAFVAGLQKVADWLTDRKVLPDQVTVADYLAVVFELTDRPTATGCRIRDADYWLCLK